MTEISEYNVGTTRRTPSLTHSHVSESLERDFCIQMQQFAPREQSKGFPSGCYDVNAAEDRTTTKTQTFCTGTSSLSEVNHRRPDTKNLKAGQSASVSDGSRIVTRARRRRRLEAALGLGAPTRDAAVAVTDLEIIYGCFHFARTVDGRSPP